MLFPWYFLSLLGARRFLGYQLTGARPVSESVTPHQLVWDGIYEGLGNTIVIEGTGGSWVPVGVSEGLVVMMGMLRLWKA